jgi:hypothetical protein
MTGAQMAEAAPNRPGQPVHDLGLGLLPQDLSFFLSLITPPVFISA